MLSFPRAVSSKRYMWIPDLLTIVLDVHNLQKAAAAAKIIFDPSRWFSKSSGGSIVVYGNHPICVRLTQAVNIYELSPHVICRLLTSAVYAKIMSLQTIISLHERS